MNNPEAPRCPKAHYPVVVIGGGINGVGVFRDLCEQGVSCLLVERSDFCSGASAAPSRLIHGGIKYLETGELRLVKQSTLERNRLLLSAPHCVKPIQTVVPARSWLGGILPSIMRFIGLKARLVDRGLLILAGGVMLFDWFGRHQRTMPRATFQWGRSFRKRYPDLASDVCGAAIYYDAKITSPERLGLELVTDGMAACADSLALNYATVERVEGGKLHLRDQSTGAEHTVTADLIVNAAGAWIDVVNRTLGIETAYIGGQKGSHIILENERLKRAIASKMLYFGSADGRIALLYEFLGNILVGSTDLPVTGADNVVCDDAEVDYMLAAVAELFPSIPVTRDQVRYRYSGVRPLPRSGSSDPGSVSRDHSIRKDRLRDAQVPVWSLIGGKWTTFRGFAEETVDLILRLMHRRRVVDTSIKPIGGGRGYPVDAQARRSLLGRLAADVGEARAVVLFERYGTQATGLVDWLALHGDLPLESCSGYSGEEIGYLTSNEMVHRLADILYRRTDIALSGRLTLEVVNEVGGVVARSLGWDDERLGEEVARVVRHAQVAHDLAPSPSLAAGMRADPVH